MTYIHIHLIFIQASLTSLINGNSLFQDVAKLCKNNGLNYITLSSIQTMSNETFDMVMEIQAHSLMWRKIPMEEIPDQHQMYQDTLLLLTKSEILLENNDDFQNYLDLMKFTQVKRSLLVFTSNFTINHRNSLENRISGLKDNAMFQVAFRLASNTQTKLYQVVSIKSARPFMNPINLNHFGHIIESYDLKVLPSRFCTFHKFLGPQSYLNRESNFWANQQHGCPPSQLVIVMILE